MHDYIKFNGSPTVEGYYTTFDSSEVHRLDDESGIPVNVDIIPLTATENKIYTAPTGKAYSPVTVDVPTSGGGSSDFSTAEVTIVDNSFGGANIYVPYILNEEGFNCITAVRGTPGGGESVILHVVLFGGGALINLEAAETQGTINTSGNITNLSGALYYITGDCTITIGTTDTVPK